MGLRAGLRPVMTRLWPILLLLAWFTVQTHAYVPVFRSNQALWAHAATMAPHKPRVLVNYGLTLMQAGELQAGVDVLLQASRAATLPHVPASDRAHTQGTVSRNLQALMQAAR